MPSQNKLDKTFLEMAHTVAKLSKDPSTKVGSVIVSNDNRKISIGYNGFAKGISDDNRLFDRSIKYELVIHAEANCIINCPFDTVDCTLYCTHQPCHKCMALIVNAGITRVIYNIPYDRLGFKEIIKEHADLLKVYRQVDI